MLREAKWLRRLTVNQFLAGSIPVPHPNLKEKTMEILSEKDNVFEFEFTVEEGEALIRFALRRIITDEIERLSSLENEHHELEDNVAGSHTYGPD